MADPDPRILPDKRQMRRAFEAAADTYDAAAELQYEIGNRLIERMDFIRLQPRRILDLGAGTGMFSAALLKRYRKADVVALDIAQTMLAAGAGARRLVAPSGLRLRGWRGAAVCR